MRNDYYQKPNDYHPNIGAEQSGGQTVRGPNIVRGPEAGPPTLQQREAQLHFSCFYTAMELHRGKPAARPDLVIEAAKRFYEFLRPQLEHHLY